MGIWALVIALLAVCSSLVFKLYNVQTELDHLKSSKRLLSSSFEGQIRNSNNPEWVEEEHLYALKNPPVETADDNIDRLTKNWNEYLDEHTPSIYKNGKPAVDCYDLKSISIPSADMATPEQFQSSDAVSRARLALKECGFVYLDNLFPRKVVEEFANAYKDLRAENGSDIYRYPCQGDKRYEVLLPFRAPFNSSKIYGDYRIRAIVKAFLNANFKLELMTVIDSPPGSGDQRWHQGWRQLWHEEERVPPYTIVVTLPLDDFTPEMGPTQFCPGKKLRLYHGYRCPEEDVIAAGSSLGTVAMFDYRTLHRGPANLSNKSRPMVSMVFSNVFFLNSHAFVNRALSYEQTITQRLYMEQWYWHPPLRENYYVV